jgi:intein-encoded DNA endonuclease-like protein
VEAVKAKTKAYVTIMPGDLAGKEFLKQVLQALMVKLTKEQREKAGKRRLSSSESLCLIPKAH